jgi:purine-nucleoside phosphorylase
VLGLSIITNINDPDRPQPATLEDVIQVAGQVTPRLTELVDGVVSRLETET